MQFEVESDSAEHHRFRQICKVVKKLKYSYTNNRGGYILSFDEKLNSVGTSNNGKVEGHLIEETIGLDMLIAGINNSMDPTTRILDRPITTLVELFNSFSWSRTHEQISGELRWTDVQRKCRDAGI